MATKKRAAAGTRGATRAATPAPTPPAKVDPLRPAPGEVIVRMYRQGLGDCFLLAFGTAKKDETRYVLIDCGVHMRQTDGNPRLLQVMEHLAKSTGNHLHVVVATHEHADHLSGFVQKGSPFLLDSLTIDQLWVAWTEKVGDSQADALRQKNGAARDVIAKAVEAARKRADESSTALAARIVDVLRFEQPAVDLSPEHRRELLNKIGKLASDRPECAERLARLTTPTNGLGAAGSDGPSSNEIALGLLAVKGEAVYCEPADVRQVPDVDQVRAYVLGPPRSALLKKDQPTKVRGGEPHEFQETYLTAGSQMQAFAMSPALGGANTAVNEDFRHPFARAYRRDLFAAANDPFFVEHYYAAEDAWRTIDADWLGAAEQLALNLDSDTNNSSLVLAFELGTPGVGPVLLFVGDAQVGNWLSWRDQKYEADGRTMSVEDLLRRTLVYKCGHHGSHNATLKRTPDTKTESGVPYGLELMNDLITLIPVDRDAAQKSMPNPWEMPQQHLYERLREKSNRRVLRADLSLEPLTAPAPPDICPPSTSWRAIPGKRGLFWRKSAEQFETGTAGPLYYDLRIPIRS